jgi:hypothetical protein
VRTPRGSWAGQRRPSQSCVGATSSFWFARVSADLDNLRAALQWHLDRGEAAPAVRLMAMLGWFLLLAGHGEEAARSLAAALALPGLVPDRERGQALFLLAFANRTHNPNAVVPVSREARAVLERGATSGAESTLTLVLAAAVRLLAGAPEEAEQLLEESMTEVERAGGWPAAVIRQVRAFNAEHARQQRALPLLRRRSGSHPLGILLLHRLGMVAQQQGDLQHAAAINRESRGAGPAARWSFAVGRGAGRLGGDRRCHRRP